jgi:hypothetical protein
VVAAQAALGLSVVEFNSPPSATRSSRREEAQIREKVRASLRRLLLGGHDDVILFPFAEQDVFAEKQIAGGHRPRGAGFTDVVDVHAAAFDVFSRRPFERQSSEWTPGGCRGLDFKNNSLWLRIGSIFSP